jgi:omega-6 fatty acid desaturase / acyl-lipid omega-6 desaturase (Delta-12 desaturase)
VDASECTNTCTSSVWDLFLVAAIYKTAECLDTFITPEQISFPSPYLYSFARFALWSLYAFANGLVMTGVWVCAHECGHQAFSESKFVNNAVGWILHSACVFQSDVTVSAVS